MLVNNIKVALLKAYNKTNRMAPALTMADVLWVNVEIWIQGDCNSRVNIVAANNSVNFSGTETIYFNRRKISDDLKGLKIPGRRTDYTGLKSVIKVLRDKCGVPLDPADFLDAAIPATGKLTIQPTTICMAYFPTDSVALDFEK